MIFTKESTVKQERKIVMNRVDYKDFFVIEKINNFCLLYVRIYIRFNKIERKMSYLIAFLTDMYFKPNISMT